MSNLLFVLGAEKTGTSTIVGMLNCHPKIFIMHEWFVDKKATRHGKYAYLLDPNIKKSMRRYSNNTICALFKSMAAQFLKAKYNYKYFGDKWAELGSIAQIETRIKEFYDFPEIKTIFTIRDIRTWVCHNRINKMYNNSENIVPTAVDYVYYFILSFKLKNNIHIKMEDVLINHPAVLKKIDKFLLPTVRNFKLHGGEWWKKIGLLKYGYNTFPKTAHKWWLHHASARVQSRLPHIEVKIKSNDFWNAMLPIFDKYYNSTSKMSIDEIDQDLVTILEFKNKYVASLDDCYEKILYNDYRKNFGN